MILLSLGMIFMGCVAAGIVAFVGLMTYAIYTHYNPKTKTV